MSVKIGILVKMLSWNPKKTQHTHWFIENGFFKNHNFSKKQIQLTFVTI